MQTSRAILLTCLAELSVSTVADSLSDKLDVDEAFVIVSIAAMSNGDGVIVEAFHVEFNADRFPQNAESAVFVDAMQRLDTQNHYFKQKLAV